MSNKRRIMDDYNAKDCEQCSSDTVCCNCQNLAWYKLEEQLKAKEQECERLKEEMFAHFHKTGEVPALLGFTIYDIANLVEENNTLNQYKKSKQASYEALQTRCNELELENRTLAREILKLNSAVDFITLTEHSAINKYNKLKQTLADIKHIAEDQKDVLESMRIDIAEQILNKISEVLDEETI